jgi:acyl-CoA reductase-like NAD-dependent aldehyde dehydrogenase
LVEEAGMENDVATAEVNVAVALLRAPPERSMSGVLGIVGDSVKPLLGALQIAVPALVAGAVVVVRPHPETPSALFALAELTGRCGFPGGVFNVLHGGEPAIAGLRSQVDVTLFFS